MPNTSSNTYDNTSLLDTNTQQSFFIQFWVFTFLTILAICFSLFALYHLFRDQQFRQALHNHMIILLLIINFIYQTTDISCIIHYFRSYPSFKPSLTFRLIWGYIEWTFFVIQYALYAWVTIERHILIFHDHLVSTRNKRFYVHYLPPFLIIIYVLIYYAVVFFIPSCTYDIDNIIGPSLFPCAFENNSLYMYDTIVHGISPTFLIVISSVILLIRSLYQRYRTQRQIQWRQYRKMTIQILIISTVYLIFPFPYMFILLLQLCGISSQLGAAFSSVVIFFTYYPLFLFPSLTVGSLPELRNKLKRMVDCRRIQRIIHPIN